MLGSLIALLCAVSWSLSVILLKISGARIHPFALNLCKNLVGLVCLLLTTYLVEGGLIWPESDRDLAILFLSGLLGIGVADCLVLESMRCLNASHIAILECLFAPFVILLSMGFLGERPTPWMLFGGVLIIGSLAFLKPPVDADGIIDRPKLRRGIVLMAFGLFLIAAGIVMIKPLFDRVPLFTLVTLRMLAGAFASLLIFGVLRNKKAKLLDVLHTPQKLVLFFACLSSAYVSIILWIAGYKYLQATVAALLNQTSTVFTVLFAVAFLKERFSRDKLYASLLALAGVAIITLAD